jgi:4-amino-4-deoxy-L-arabinose transferase-like glycosyltransferase
MLTAMSTPWQRGAAAPARARRRVGPAGARRARIGERLAALRRPRPELVALLALAGVLNLWALSRNGLANDYYSAAIRSMSTSWHDFLFASLDQAGVMSVDKPPLALWVQALSVRLFGYHSLSILVPQALMGIASVALVYDLVRRRFGRLGGFVGGLTLALTPITVAISRHNNPDALLVLCAVVALWCAVRALEDGRTGWLVAAGVFVGLGFETKMGVVLTVVPAIAAAWMWLAPAGRGRLHALRQLLAGGGAMLLVGGAWPALVELTPAAGRPWVSGTSDNSVLSLIFEYNGVGRVDGQAGGPRGLGGTAGPLRLLNSALGGQGGWLLGFAALSGLGILLASRLRRSDPRSGWLLAVGGTFLVTAVLFSFAGGIFHPYYVSLLAPFTAALVGAGAARLARGGEGTRVLAPAAIAAGVAVELVVLADYPGQMPWLAPVLIVVGALAALTLIADRGRSLRIAAVLSAVAALTLAPAVWAFDTLGHSASGTFPEGGPASLQALGGGFGAPGGLSARAGLGVPGGALGPGSPPPLFGPGGAGGFGGGGPRPVAGAFAGRPPGGGPGGFGGSVSTRILGYVKAHGGGTIAVSSQSSAARAIIGQGADVAGIGGFSGRESTVSLSWLAHEVSSGKIRWALAEEQSGAPGGAIASDRRAGSRAAFAAVAQACRRVSLPTSSNAAAGASRRAGTAVLYDCRGRGAELSRLGA